MVRKVEAITSASLEIRAEETSVLVTGAVTEDQPVEPGQWIDVRGRFLLPNRLEASALHVHRFRRLKILVSLIPPFLVFLLLRRTLALQAAVSVAACRIWLACGIASYAFEGRLRGVALRALALGDGLHPLLDALQKQVMEHMASCSPSRGRMCGWGCCGRTEVCMCSRYFW